MSSEVNESGASVKKTSSWRKRVLMCSLPVLLAVGGGYTWLTGGQYITTDNAYVYQPLVPVSADVSGKIVQVSVVQNQQIKAGDVVFQIDPEPYQIAFQKADAALNKARLEVAELRSAYSIAVAQLNAAQEMEKIHKRELARQQDLVKKGHGSSSAVDSAMATLQTAKNEVVLSREGVKSALVALHGDPKIKTDDLPNVKEAIAQKKAAERDLNHTTILASVDGIVSQTDSLKVGRYVSPGTMVASIAETGDTWIEANLKETQLNTLRIGQSVDVEIDAYPDFKLNGKVESIGSTTGSQLSLIPAQNATGNWVKVVQRVPVRVLVQSDAEHPLRGGMSAYVSIDAGRSRLEKLL